MLSNKEFIVKFAFYWVTFFCSDCFCKWGGKEVSQPQPLEQDFSFFQLL